jgi:hypothetical protein
MGNAVVMPLPRKLQVFAESFPSCSTTYTTPWPNPPDGIAEQQERARSVEVANGSGAQGSLSDLADWTGPNV